MLLASALIHLALLGLFLLSLPDKQPQATSPPSIDIMVDPESAADVAADRPPDGAPTLGQPSAPDEPQPTPDVPSPAPTPPVDAPQPPADATPPPIPVEPVPAEPTPAPPQPVDPAPQPPVASPAPEPPTPAPVQVEPQPVAPPAPDATVPPPPQETPPPPVPSSSPPRVNLNMAPLQPIPPPQLQLPPAPPPPPAPPRPNPPPAFPAPIVSSWNANPFAPQTQPQRQRRGNGGIDLSLGPTARASRGAPPRGKQDSDANIRVEGANLGPDWLQLMQEWWVRHRYYPTQAAQNGEDGTVQVQLELDRYGKVHGVRIESTSGSQWLDAGALSIFRNAQLPPFPSGTLEAKAGLHLTLNFYLIRR